MTGALTIDLNADLGESYGRWQLGDDAALLDIVTSANIACGFHAGDPTTLLRTVRLAAERGVAIGAQVGYPDLVGFGRRFIDIAPDDLTAAVIYQIGALDGLARTVGARVRYIKPHGALYNAVVAHEGQAAALVEAVTSYDAGLPILGLPGSALLRRATEAGVAVVAEAFIDRGYTDSGALVPRTEPGALLHDGLAERATEMVTAGSVRSATGHLIPIAARSLCVHGDSIDAVDTARSVRAALTAAGVTVAPFAA